MSPLKLGSIVPTSYDTVVNLDSFFSQTNQIINCTSQILLSVDFYKKFFILMGVGGLRTGKG